MSPQNEKQKRTELAATGKLRNLVSSLEFKSAVAAVLPAHLPPERFVRVALTALLRTPKLADSDQASFFQCLLTLSQLGLEPDGRLAHLIPFWNSKRNVYECTLIVDYKGLVSLAIRSGRISYIHADRICEADHFVYDRGEIVHHRIDFKKPRGEAYAYYALVRFKDGTEQAEVMPKDDVDKIRSRSHAANNGPWVTDYEEMAKKTVFRRLTKWLELSPEYRDALEADADNLAEKRFDAALPIERPVFDALPSSTKAEQEEPKREPATAPPPAKPKAATQKEQPQPKDEQEIRKTAERESETPYSDELTKRLNAIGCSDSDFLCVALMHQWVDKGTHFINNIGEDRAKNIVDNWNLVLDKLDQHFVAKGAKSEIFTEPSPFL